MAVSRGMRTSSGLVALLVLGITGPAPAQWMGASAPSLERGSGAIRQLEQYQLRTSREDVLVRQRRLLEASRLRHRSGGAPPELGRQRELRHLERRWRAEDTRRDLTRDIEKDSIAWRARRDLREVEDPELHVADEQRRDFEALLSEIRAGEDHERTLRELRRRSRE
jgi:hypothetical protein